MSSQSSQPEIRLDCRHYRGDRPCFRGYLCAPECDRFEALGQRILVVKLGALGDVVRTTPLLRTLPASLGACHITWVTDRAAVELLAAGGRVDRVLAVDDPALPFLLAVERFDLAVCLDKEPRACAVLALARADSKRGFGLLENGAVAPVNAEAEELWRLGLDDERKFFRNTRSYPQLMHEAIALPYAGEEYCLPLPEVARRRARRCLAAAGAGGAVDGAGAAGGLDGARGAGDPGGGEGTGAREGWRREGGEPPLVGFQVGAGDVFANKAWTVEGLAAAVRAVVCGWDAQAVLLGGAREAARVDAVAEAAGVPVIRPGTGHDLVTFAALVAELQVVVTGDTLAMHLAIAAGSWVVAIFGPTCAQEIDLYGRGERIVTPLDCAPCYRRQCDVHPSCMEVIGVERVVEAIGRGLREGKRASGEGA